MPTGTYKIADTVIRISSLFDEIHEMCSDYRCEDEPEIFIETEASDVEFERKKSAEEDIYEGLPIRSFHDSYLETLAVYRKLAIALLRKDTVLFHGSVIAVDGVGYLFTAKSGTGKSTHTRLWREKFGDRAVMINDDKPLLHVTDDGIIAYGTPWDGKHHLSKNTSVPLKAICILERAEDNHIAEITMRDALTMLYQQTYRPNDADAMRLTMNMIAAIGNKCRLYRLGCNMEPEAADVSYNGMQ